MDSRSLHIHHHHKEVPLAELHTHLGGAVDAAILWTIAHEQGIRLPTKDYWEFEKMVTVNTHGGLHGVRQLDQEKYHWTELIQSSPLAMESAVHGTIGGAYRANHIVLHEIRYNPMKRNRGGEQDLDHIIMATIRGMERAFLEYEEVRAGIILCLDRTFPFRLNEIIYQKALKYQKRGIIGIDLAGPPRKEFHMKDYVDLFREAKQRGFGITMHTGEEGALQEMRLVIEKIEPQRIGHGILASRDRKLMRQLLEKHIVLELCPTSNLNIGIVKNLREMKRIYRTLYEAGVLLTINTDGPEMHGTNLWKEINFLCDHDIFSRKELDEMIQNAFHATFISQS
ncbi:MAG: adenosine deaminase [Patescibacteria group bacterium]